MAILFGCSDEWTKPVTPEKLSEAEIELQKGALAGQVIAFASDRDRNFEIYVMRADGSHQTRLTDNLAEDVNSDWSPKGKRIALTSNRDGNPEIYVMNANGSSQTNLTNNPAFDADPAWRN